MGVVSPETRRFEPFHPTTANPSLPCPAAPAQLHTRPLNAAGGPGRRVGFAAFSPHHDTERRERCSTSHTGVLSSPGVPAPSDAAHAGSMKPAEPSSPVMTGQAVPSPCDDQMPTAPSGERTEGSKPCGYGRRSRLRVWVRFPRAVTTGPRSECPPVWRPFARS